MTPLSAKQVYDQLVAHIDRQGGPYSGWYVGISSDWHDRLFGDHEVPRKDYWFIARQCFNSDDARRVEQEMLKLGCDGGGGGGNQNAVHVYAYLKGPQTNP